MTTFLLERKTAGYDTYVLASEIKSKLEKSSKPDAQKRAVKSGLLTEINTDAIKSIYAFHSIELTGENCYGVGNFFKSSFEGNV